MRLLRCVPAAGRRPVSSFGALALALCASALVAPQLYADQLPLGFAANYAVLYAGSGTGNNQLSISNVTINGNVGVGGCLGVGGCDSVQFSGPGTITGELDFSGPNMGQFHNTNGSNVGPSSVTYNNANVTSALNTVDALSSSLAGDGNSLAINGNQTIDESAGALETINGVSYYVFNVTAYSEGNGNIVNIVSNGSGDPVVLNFGMSSNTNLGGDVTLTGLDPDQVLWNFTSSGENVGLNNNASSYGAPLAFMGDILAPNDCLSVVNSNVDGRIIGGGGTPGSSGCNLQIVSGDTINAPATVPEPSSWLLFGAGLIGLATLRRRHALGRS